MSTQLKLTQQRRRQLAIIFIILACVVTLDQTTKTLVRAKLPANDFSFFHEGTKFFRITHQTNTGLVGGMFTGKRLMALGAPLFASIVLLYLYRFLDPASRIQTLAFGLVSGGAIGNLIDRIRLGWVTDFLQFHFYFIPFDFPWKIFPAFNIADSCICTGVFLLVVMWHKVAQPDVSDPA